MTNIIYKVTSYGGMDGRRLETEYYTTEENARNSIVNSTWNTGHKLYKVTLTVNEEGLITAEEEKIEL